jgi:hypothetical protein
MVFTRPSVPAGHRLDPRDAKGIVAPGAVSTPHRQASQASKSTAAF